MEDVALAAKLNGSAPDLELSDEELGVVVGGLVRLWTSPLDDLAEPAARSAGARTSAQSCT